EDICFLDKDVENHHNEKTILSNIINNKNPIDISESEQITTIDIQQTIDNIHEKNISSSYQLTNDTLSIHSESNKSHPLMQTESFKTKSPSLTNSHTTLRKSEDICSCFLKSIFDKQICELNIDEQEYLNELTKAYLLGKKTILKEQQEENNKFQTLKNEILSEKQQESNDLSSLAFDTTNNNNQSNTPASPSSILFYDNFQKLDNHLLSKPNNSKISLIENDQQQQLSIPSGMISLKHELFINEPIAMKTTNVLPGIGTKYAQQLSECGFTTVRRLLGFYLMIKDDQHFVIWLNNKAEISIHSAWLCTNALRAWCEAYLINNSTKIMNYPVPSYGVAAPSAKFNKKTIIIIIVIAVVVGLLILGAIAIALGVGLGVGLSRRNNASSSNSNISTYSILSAPTVTCTYGGSATCGCAATKPSFLTPRITQGYTGTAYSWPWIVALYINNAKAFCGGFLVSYQHVVTAAHCVSGVTPSTITVYAGIQTLSSRSSSQSRVVYNLTTHPSYSASDHTNDIAILTLQSAFDQTSIVGKCCLTFDSSLPSIGEHAVLAGWGVTSSSSTTVSDQLLQGVIQVQSRSSSCPISSSSLQICAGYDGTDACYGDSGSPLMTSVNNSWTCTGIVSSGRSCGQSSLYTRVSAYRSFIQGIIGS
ncbi:unnamed protein product, partial [Rotaria sp. Silwood1]